MDYEIITGLSNKDVFNIAHKFTTLKGSDWKPTEIDFLFAFISEIKEDDEDFKEYQIDTHTLSNKMQRRMKKDRVAKLFDVLITKYISFSNNTKEKRYSIFDTLEYDSETEIYTVRFSSQMKPFFLKIKPFTKGYLSDIFKLESAYAKQIYLLCSQWKKIGSFRIKVEILQDSLQVPKSLTRYDNFKRKVLKVAQKSMKENSSIYFDFEEIKKGRKVDEIIFKIYSNEKNEKNKKLFNNKPNIQKQIRALTGRKMYVNGKLFFFQEIIEEKGCYNIIANDEDGRIATIKTNHISPEATIETIQQMMEEQKN